jgi:U4/U6.U5 tri-snRNP-associated protein 1
MSMEESISLEETNKIRISLGLKPLTDDSAPADNKEKQAEDNYARRREEDAKARESKCVLLLSLFLLSLMARCFL